ncbi:MAG TPA: anthranilate phosphoribosyltransferase [Pyrinomonadaceae bacterium]|nr:anthranilate phosphoribosyltransferase [Pyrinomonadaceae bacterium]
MNSILRKYIDEFKLGHPVDAAEAESFLDALINETDESVLASVLVEWNKKGIEEGEIYELARVLRSRMKRVNSRHEIFVDIVGTGGSKAKTFNVSTAAAFVVAGAGIPVAKHGNKAATSNSGSSDVLAELGINPAIDPETAERCLNEIGICFMFAPNHHRLSPTLAKVRRGLGFPTIFNCVGPLCNPASAPHQLIGVWDEALVPKIGNALARLGTTRSWIVGGNGLDEISLEATTLVAEIVSSDVTLTGTSPAQFGVESFLIESFRCADAVASSAMVRKVLNGEASETPAENIVALNAAVAIVLARPTMTNIESLEAARESIRSGSARRKLEELALAIPG